MRRSGPRPLAAALEDLAGRLAPPGTLSRVQACWAEVAGPVVSAEAEPVSERGGVVTVACRSAVWAQELDLLSADLLARLNAVLVPAGEPPAVSGLRFTAARPRTRP